MAKHRKRPEHDIRLVTVLRTSDWGIVAIAKSVLENAGIDYFVKNEVVRGLQGWQFSAYPGDAEFQVREADAPAASRLLARLDKPIAPHGED